MENEMLVPLEKPSRDVDFGTPTMDRVENAQRSVERFVSNLYGIDMAGFPDSCKRAAAVFRQALQEYKADPSVITVKRDPQKLIKWFEYMIKYYETLEILLKNFYGKLGELERGKIIS